VYRYLWEILLDLHKILGNFYLKCGGNTGVGNHEVCTLQVEEKRGVEGWLFLFRVFKIFRENL
jgi:hypothetical protein